jgi:methyl-accepting chemotaxis protein
MNKTWSFGRKIAAGFAVSSALLLIIGWVAYRSIDSLTLAAAAVTHSHQVEEEITTLLSLLTDAETGQRGYIITGDDAYLKPYLEALAGIPEQQKSLRNLTLDNPDQQRRLDQLETLQSSKLAELKRTIDLRRTGGFEAAAKLVSAGEGKQFMDDIRRLFEQMDLNEKDLLAKRAADAQTSANTGKSVIVLGTLLCLLFVIAAGIYITRSLVTQIGAAVGHVQSSSSELQAAAAQQASGAREQATAMSEITTTISELAATSRQIAESAQRVAQVAEQTASAARSGDVTVGKGQESISGIRRQMDLVVKHMLDLGRKSQEIGAVLEIVSELAEQTNILAINATIEATGAGETGRRFAVVADEIRKLADRMANSTKQIRTQIDDVRSAVNTTVMATETGAKAVEGGARQFTEVAVSFKQIAALVATTTDASREIELSTKQQVSAADQVRIAVTDVAQATQEAETSSSQTLQTASQLAGLSMDLRRLIQPEAA